MTELENYIQASFGILEKGELNKISSLFEQSKLKKGDFLLIQAKSAINSVLFNQDSCACLLL